MYKNGSSVINLEINLQGRSLIILNCKYSYKMMAIKFDNDSDNKRSIKIRIKKIEFHKWNFTVFFSH